MAAMTYVITGGCCNDSSCIPACPVQCIRPRPGDPDFISAEHLYIDPATCIDCGACMDECPIGVVYSEWALPDDLGEYLAVNRDYFTTNPIVTSAPPEPVRRRLPAERPSLSVAVVGTGPAGCYAAAELSGIKGVTVSMFDRLPTPFGLVRAGVAPDHANTKLIGKQFQAMLGRPNVHCFFNVEVGRDISVPELLEHQHAVVWSGGAGDDRRLGIPGEDLEGCVSAREFVAWYNGHPDVAGATFDLSGTRAVVIGNGNVALDVARMLAQPADVLSATDLADPALEVLRQSRIAEVVVVARRGPEVAAYSSAELSGLARSGVRIRAERAELAGLVGADDRRAKLLTAAVARTGPESARTVTFRFGLTPESIDGDGRVEAVTFRRADGSREVIEAPLVVRAIGYRGRPVAGLPFDEVAGTFAHRGGRVIDPAGGEPVAGVYCSGWIKRGATGVIGTNRTDSAETVEALLRDFGSGRLADPAYDKERLERLLRGRQPDLVDKAGWARIDQAERRAGRASRRPRVKFLTVEELLAASRPCA